jgi:F-type H+-transporting ATPase subunit b
MEKVIPDYTVIVQAAIFLISLLFIKKFILDPIYELLQRRTTRIEGGEQDARRLEQEANALDSSYRQKIQEARVKAMALRNEMRQEALVKEKEILKEGRGNAHDTLERIRREIADEIVVARSMLQQQASELSVRFGEKILGRRLQ